MSRTTRRPKFYLKTSETKHINRDIARAIRFPDHYIRVRMTEEELDTEYQRNLVEFERVKKTSFFALYFYLSQHYSADYYKEKCDSIMAHKPTRRTKGFKRVAVEKSMDEVIAESKRDFATYTRDGKWNETSRNTGFKRAAASCVRRANKRFCSAVIRGEEYEDTIYPHEHLGDYLVWSFW